MLKHTQKNSSKNIIGFIEQHQFENGFTEHYDKYLRPIFEQHESRRQQYLNLVNKRLKNSLIAVFIAILMAMFFTITAFSSFYDKISETFNNLMVTYNKWWSGLHGIFRFILPSDLVAWSFPSPLTIIIILILALSARCLFPVFSYRRSIKYSCTMPILNFMGDFKYNQTNQLIGTGYYNALALPAFDEGIFDNGSFRIDYKDVTIDVSELKLMIFSQGKTTFKTPSFMGFIVVCDFNNFNLELGGRNIIVTNPDKALDKLLLEDELKLLDLSNNLKLPTHLYSTLEENFTKPIFTNLAKVIDDASVIINKNNDFDSNNLFDDKIINRLTRFLPPTDEVTINKSIQLATIENKVFLMIPFNRELFAKSSIFTSSYKQEDIHLILSTINMIYNIIDVIKK